MGDLACLEILKITDRAERYMHLVNCNTCSSIGSKDRLDEICAFVRGANALKREADDLFNDRFAEAIKRAAITLGCEENK